MGRQEHEKEPEEETEETLRRKTTYGEADPTRPDLSCVPAPWRETVGDLFDTWSGVRGRNLALRRYYEMKKDVENLGISIPPTLKATNCVTGWCAKAVCARANRSIFDGFVFEGAEDAALKRLVRENRLRSKYREACASALVYGVSALTVMRGGPGQPDVVVRVFSANQFCALWDKDAERVAAAVVLADLDREGRPSRYVVHLPEAVLTLSKGEDGSWSCASEPNPMGRPMMELVVHDPDPDRPLGHSLLTPELLGIVDKAMRDIFRMELGAEFFTFPQRYILGADEDLFSPTAAEEEEGGDEGAGEDGGEGDAQPAPSPAARFQAYIGAWLAITRDEEGEVPQVGQFSPVSADNFTRVFENDAQRFSGASNIPLSQLGVLSSTYTSSDALGAANDPLILDVERINADNSEAMETVARMMMAVSDGVPYAELDEQKRSVQAVFKDPAMPTVSARADAYVKIGSADAALVGTPVWYEGLGMPQATIDRIKAQKEQGGAIASLNAMADAMALQAAKASALPPAGGDPA